MQIVHVSSSQKGFTLIEMLVVMVIIGLLVGLVGPKIFSRVDSSKIQTAQAQIKMLKGALDTVKLDIGRFPTTEEGLGILITPPTEGKYAKRWKGPYLEEAMPDDPWGNPYQYAFPGAPGKPFALYSFGADGVQGGTENDADIGYLPLGDS
ncbi:type II secretion system major pseudopilin GspG [Deefgea piscis]|uniref:type II secretion system major pseudopilin GspG n=1 Tax=Deefgea piscis TaxID=2739061 RepID=UPI001C7FD932|nr:type II secretion system major pseudopilin GspG [Deefgea piscis]QZA80553.1 type II secretion system major pseudopilin GspG [Deefgea piscis]